LSLRTSSGVPATQSIMPIAAGGASYLRLRTRLADALV